MSINSLKDEIKGEGIVFGDGNPSSDIMIIGEAPGAKEEELGKPFVGRSGKLLELSLEEIGIKREDVYITNIVKKRPPENRNPKAEEIKFFSPYLKKEIDIVSPKIIVTLGRFSLQYFIPKAKISKMQGKLTRAENYLIFPIFHPAAALRSSSRMTDFKKSFKNLKKYIDKHKHL